MTTVRRLAALLAVVLLAASCGGDDDDTASATPETTTTTAAPESTFPVDIDTELGSITVTSEPQRIVSLSPTATETLYAIGAGDEVVAVDKSSSYPEDAPRTELSGFTPNAEAIAGFDPDLVVTARDKDGMFEALGALDIPVLVLPSAATEQEALDQMTALGAATGHVDEAAELVEGIQLDLKGLEASAADREPMTYYYEISSDYYAASTTSFVGSLLSRIGLTSIADGADGDFPQLSAEHIISADPDLVLLADVETGQQTAAIVSAREGWGGMRAVSNGNVIELDGDIANRWGPRMVDLVRAVDAAASGAG